MQPQLQSLSPMLAVKDVAKTASYYQEFFGYEILFVSEDDSLPGYAVVRRDGFSVHFLEDLDRDSSEVRSGFSATVNDVDRLFEEFKSVNAFAEGFPRHLDAIREHPPEDKSYGMRDMIFVDPNGYILVFGHPL